MSSDDLRELYKALILDHAREPRHFGVIEAPTHEASGVNPLCGDKLRLYIRVHDDRIDEIRFDGTGCAISVASASLMAEAILGMPIADALTFSERFINRLAAPEACNENFDPGPLRALEGVREYPSRVKCATLAWQTLKSAIKRNEAPASTE